MERPRTGGGGISASSGGYSRRYLPGDPKSNDRHRLLTDRAAYIAFLEAQAERANAICLEAEEVSSGLKSMRDRMDELEEKVRGTARAVELVQDLGARTGESSRAGRMEIEDQLRVCENRVQRLESSVGDARATTEAEMARLRNEVALTVQDFGQRVDERIQALRAWRFEADEGASGVIREAQATCVRLADDALGAVEASQHKIEELSRRTEAGLEVLQVDMTGLRAELAGITHHEQHHASRGDGVVSSAALPGSGASPTFSNGVAGMARAAGEETASAIADAVERRLGARLGQQVLQLSEVLRRVVQAQNSLHQQLSGGSSARASTSAQVPPHLSHSSPASLLSAVSPPMSSGQAVDFATSSHPGLPLNSAPQPGPGTAPAVAIGVASDAHRRVAIDELYEELRRLEECDNTMKRSSSASPSLAATRRPRSSRIARSAS